MELFEQYFTEQYIILTRTEEGHEGLKQLKFLSTELMYTTSTQ